MLFGRRTEDMLARPIRTTSIHLDVCLAVACPQFVVRRLSARNFLSTETVKIMKCNCKYFARRLHKNKSQSR